MKAHLGKKIPFLLQKNSIKHKKSCAGLLVLSFVLLLPAFQAFPGAEQFAWLLLCPLAYILSKSLNKYFTQKKEAEEEKEFANFLSYLSSAVSAGHNLELSLMEARNKMDKELNEASRVREAVSQVRISLFAGLGLRGALKHFTTTFRQKTIRTFAHILPSLAERGGRYDVFLQLQRDSLHKELELKAELKAEQSASVMEAFIMSLMPFILSFCLSRSAYTRELKNRVSTPTLQALLLALSVIGFCLSLRLLASQPEVERFPRLCLPKLLAKPAAMRKLLFQLSQSIASLYGTARYHRCLTNLAYLFPHKGQVWERFILLKVLISAGFTLSSWLSTKQALALLLVPLGFFFPDIKMRDALRKIRSAEQAEYPPFLTLLAILLESGLNLERSLHLSLLAWIPETNKQAGSPAHQKRNRKKSVLVHDLLLLKQQLESGLPADRAMEWLAENRFHAEIAQCLFLMARFAREGGEEQIQMIKVQAMRSTDHYRNATRERLAKKSLKLLLPLTYELLLVLTIAALPAILQFYT